MSDSVIRSARVSLARFSILRAALDETGAGDGRVTAVLPHK
jgi:hypothetical protein